jgi:intracellular septation protein A
MLQFVPVVVVVLAIGFRYLSNLCIESSVACYTSVLHQSYASFTIPLYFLTLYLLPLTIILIFIQREAFRSWFKFAAGAIPLLLIFIWTQPVYAQHILSTNRDDAARLAGGVFTVASLILIVWKYIITRKNRAL